MAAVLFVDGRIVYTDWEPSADVLALFRERRDEQIMGWLLRWAC